MNRIAEWVVSRSAIQAILPSMALIAVTVAIVSDMGFRAPGELAAIHERVPELVGSSGCDHCHGAAQSLMADSCLACHEVVDTQLASNAGLHGVLDPVLAAECALCHGEHHGPEFRPAGAVAFFRAGIPDPDQFDHGMLGIELKGEHQALSCRECHQFAEDDVPPPGEPRFGGLHWQCASCHDDPHEGVFGERCASCHGQSDFTDSSDFTHDARFPLEGAHAAPECAECHPSEGAHSFAVLSQSVPQRPTRECIECHESPHAESFVSTSAVLAQTTPGDSCATCHSSEQVDFGDDALEFHSEQHIASGFPLEVPHDQLECADCHTEDAIFQERFPGRLAEDCSECHDDPHAGEFEQGTFAAQGCLGCHAQTHFSPNLFDAQLHAITALPLTGSHLELDCKECHADPATPLRGDFPAAQQVARFDDAPTRCEDCHTDAHRGAFAVAPAGLTLDSGGQCAQCHDTQSFRDVATDRFDHGTWTGFPLEGSHESAACDSCHTRSPAPDASGRTLGYVADHVTGSATACASCHENPHEGAFDDPAFPAATNGQDGCARCHDALSFAGAAETFEHALWTGFVLDGAHAQAGCLECHPALDTPTQTGRVHATAVERFGVVIEDCASCHSNPHGDRFDRPGQPMQVVGRFGCARCHGTVSFRELSGEGFEHGLWTGFVLDGGHADVSCSSCHAPSAHPDELGRTFAAAEGTRCADCHADPHAGQFRGQGEAADCDRCHGKQSLTQLTFDHQTDSRFQLDESHAELACAACHKPWHFPGGGSVVRYRPLGRECTDCHGVGGGKRRTPK